MCYAYSRDLGLFGGSGAADAGGPAAVAHRLKQSGMRGSVGDSASIVSLGCQEATRPSRRNQIWHRLPTGRPPPDPPSGLSLLTPRVGSPSGRAGEDALDPLHMTVGEVQLR